MLAVPVENARKTMSHSVVARAPIIETVPATGSSSGKTFPRLAIEFIILQVSMDNEPRMPGPAVKFKIAPKIVVASLERNGPYAGVADAVRELKSWLDFKGVKQVGHPFCLYYDNPTETPEQELRSEVCIPVARALESEGKSRVKEMAETEVAETRHQGPPDQFAMTYGPFLEGLLKGGYRILGPAREYYMTVSDVTGPGAGFLIQQPVARK